MTQIMIWEEYCPTNCMKSSIWCLPIYRISKRGPFCKNIHTLSLCQRDLSQLNAIQLIFFEAPIRNALSDLIFVSLIAITVFRYWLSCNLNIYTSLFSDLWKDEIIFQIPSFTLTLIWTECVLHSNVPTGKDTVLEPKH